MRLLLLTQEFEEVYAIIIEFYCWKYTYNFTGEETETQRSINTCGLTDLTSDTFGTWNHMQSFLVSSPIPFPCNAAVPNFPLEYFQHKKQTSQVEGEQGSKEIAVCLGPGPKLKFAEWDNI